MSCERRAAGRCVRGLRAFLLLTGVLAACDEDGVPLRPNDPPAPPQGLDARYFAGAVTVTWTLGADWDGEVFRVYARRVTDPDHFLVAEVTGCAEGACEYRDANVAAGATYEYYVAAVDASGRETPSARLVEVAVPMPDPPAAPVTLLATALDGSVFLSWSGDARGAEDFSHYRVYLDGEEVFLLGETDSEGFLDLRASNGRTYRYFVSALDDLGHESAGSPAASATPRPDRHGELIRSYLDAPASSGFRFPASERDDPIVHGDAADRHFRFERDRDGWWLVPGPGTEIHGRAFATDRLKCGPASDAGCVDVTVAPRGDYAARALEALPATTYVFRYSGAEGRHYAAVRIASQGFVEEDAVMVFDWAHQLQPGNVGLERPASEAGLRAGA